MWLLGKIKESMESIPLELTRYVGKSEEDLCLSSKTSLSHTLHNNILTPDKIPEFFLPPRLCKRSSPLAPERAPPYLPSQIHKSPTAADSTHATTKDVSKSQVVRRAKKKPLPFSAEGYGLVGMYESPNTRRKESLFHAKRPAYLLDRTVPRAAPKFANERDLPKTTTTLSGFLPLFPCKSLSEAGSTESETPSSSDSSPLGSPYTSNSSLSILLKRGRLKGTTSCPSLINIREERVRWKEGVSTLTGSLNSFSSSEGNPMTLGPPCLFPLDVLHCQERLQHQHILPLLPGQGKVRLSTEHTASSATTSSSLSTVRVRVVSVEGLREDGDQRPLNCAVSLCLVPGKLQRQESATIRNCRSPVFNEDFFFTELSQESLLALELRLKVMDKPGTGALKRGTVIAIITKPLSQLLPLSNE
ncbi:LOW QUALITY PROTEIN: C2 calcium-dependent domain-containing protein 4C [Myripristis murdjan]|uniref:LOW QUALITY PROTEIN: C2 calcium-dependent domain-containing protein 4C n=1 Tax=Myripristis murdjan TaxID=586833 RepID=UPI003F494F2C